MGRVTPDRCDTWHGALAMEALGLLDEHERPGLQAHLDGCADCRDELASLAPLRAALDGADPSRIEPPVLPRHLEGTVLARLEADSRSHRRRYRALAATAAVAACLVAALATLVALGPFGPAGPRTLALHGPPGVSAQAVLVSERWGTQVQFRESGQAGTQVYAVSVVGTSGRWWSAGTYTTQNGQGVRVDMACALAPDQIAYILVRDPAGATVLRSND